MQNTDDADAVTVSKDGSPSVDNGVSVVLGVAWTTKVWIGAVFANFVVTLAVFPAITSLVKSVDAGNVSCPSSLS